MPLSYTLIAILLTAPNIGSAHANHSSTESYCTQTHNAELLGDLRTLSSDKFTGRETGTPGHTEAKNYLSKRFSELSLQTFKGRYAHPFSFKDDRQGSNIIGYIEGRAHPERYLVVTAHYDHLGSKGRRIYNGADDNASGVAALLALASRYRQTPPRHSVIFVATDAEEPGLHGAHALLRALPVTRSSVVLNINIDMIGQGGFRDQLFLVHDGKHKQLETILEQVQSRSVPQHVRLELANARSLRSRLTRNDVVDWRDASDYAVFASHNIPFVHIGTATHQYYHTPADTFENIDEIFFTTSAGIVQCVVEALDSTELGKKSQ